MSKRSKGPPRADDGATAIEYAIVAALVSVAIIASAAALGTSVSSLFDRAATQVEQVTDSMGT